MSVSKKNIPALVGDLEPRKIYPVTEDELIIWEKGMMSSSLHLNFAIAFLTSALSATVAYFSITSDLTFNAMAFIYAVMFSGYGMGVFLLILYWKGRSNQTEILYRIRARIEASKLQKLLDQSTIVESESSTQA